MPREAIDAFTVNDLDDGMLPVKIGGQRSLLASITAARSTPGSDSLSIDGYNGAALLELWVASGFGSGSAALYLEGQNAGSPTWYGIGFHQLDGILVPQRATGPIYLLTTPTAPTLTPSSTGGKLAAGTYYYAWTNCGTNPTTESPIGAASASTGALTGSTNQVTVSAPIGPTGTAARSCYRSTDQVTWGLVGGLPDNTTTSFVDSGNVTPGVAPPTTFQHLFLVEDPIQTIRLRAASISALTYAAQALLLGA